MTNTKSICGPGPQCEPEIYADYLDDATNTLQRLRLQDVPLAVDGLSGTSKSLTEVYSSVTSDQRNNSPEIDNVILAGMFEEEPFSPTPSPPDDFGHEVSAGTWGSCPRNNSDFIPGPTVQEADEPAVSASFVERPAAQIPESIDEDAYPIFPTDQYVMAKLALINNSRN